jgi:hypothetical protein
VTGSAPERRCVYCKRRLGLRRGAVMVFEMDGVRVLARCHTGCREKAAKR